MKKISITFILFTTIIFLFFSCNNEDILNNDNTSLIAESNKLYFEKIENFGKYSFLSEKKENKIESTLILEIKDKQTIQINYNYDFTEAHWKIKQEKRVEEKAKELSKFKLDKEVLIQIEKSLLTFLEKNYFKINDKTNFEIIASLNFHKSIVLTNYRALVNNEECDCNIHPAYLADKTNFNCQEDQILQVTELKNILKKYKDDGNVIDIKTQNLIDYLGQTSKSNIDFEKYYSFYFTEIQFDNFKNSFTENIIFETFGDCGWYCILGCGSDNGCCGNYSGCCLYAHPACYVHDRLCRNCTPAWFCGPACKPDKSTSIH